MPSSPLEPRQLQFKQNYEAVAAALVVWVNLHLFPHVRGRLEVDDVVQEVWCRAYQRFGEFDTARGSFRAWVFGIANNVLLEELRRLSRTPRGLRADIGGPPQDRTALPENELAAEMTSISERAARKEAVVRLLEQAAALPEEDRQLLICRGLEGQPYNEVCARLGISSEAARSRWRRLREQLREASEDAAFWAED